MNSNLQVLYEDNHLLILNKPSGMLAQGDNTKDISLVEEGKKYLKEKYNKPGNVFLGLAHRLDRPVSGAIALARTSKALTRITKIFQERKVQKVYWAVVKKQPTELIGNLLHWIVKDHDRNVVKAYDSWKKGSKRAELNYQLIGKSKDYTLLEIEPITGRPHQIRAQLAKIGTPIKGDLKYGYIHPNNDKSINLHSRKLSFIHPVKDTPIEVVAPIPQSPAWQHFMDFEAKAN